MGNQKKICLITGATAGIGRAAAAILAAQGLEMVLVGRNAAKLEDVTRQIRVDTDNDSVHFLVADFSDLGQVKQLADQFNGQFPRLDILINNAGAHLFRHQRTIYGVEKTFLVNYLAHFLLTNLLLDRLEQSAPSRIINVASNAHEIGRLDLGI
jgi:NAD(P)-dependent dehydrogenase (short-subunit alcohol dehydrogenase family)